MRITVVFLTLFLASLSVSYAQELSWDQQYKYNPRSVSPVRRHDISFRKSLWWRIDLRQKMNK